MDAYQFTGVKGQHILVNAVTTGGSLNTMLSLYAPSGAKEAYTLGGGDKLDWTLREDGPYTMVMEDYNSYQDTGDYTFSFLNLPGGPVSYSGDADGGAVTSGETRTGKINTSSDMDAYQFTGVKGQHILVNAVTTGGSLNTMLSLYSPSGAKEAYTLGGGDKLDWTLREDGPYTMVVEDYNSYKDTGDYTFSFLNLPGGPLSYSGDPDGGAITSGETRTGKINTSSDMDAYQFTGVKGQHILVNAVTTGGSLNTMLSLYSPSGAKEAYTLGGGDKLDWTLREDGPYTMVVEEYNSYKNTGDYTFSFLNLPGGPFSYSGDADGGAVTSGENPHLQNQYFLGYGRLSVHRRERSAHPC